MSRGRLAAASLLLVALVLSGSAATVLFAARSQEEKAQPLKVQFQAASPEEAVFSESDLNGLDPKLPVLPFQVQPEFSRAVEPKSPPKPEPPLVSKAGKPELQVRASDSELHQAFEAAPGKESGQGDVYTWQDGDRTIRLVLQEDLMAQETSANAAEEDVVVAKGQVSVLRKDSVPDVGAQPVFKAESGGGLMTLPGGVLLALDTGWGTARVEEFFAANEISAERLTELEFLDNGFLVETEPGFPSLALANALAGQE